MWIYRNIIGDIFMDIKCCNCGAVGQEKADGVCTKERKLVVFNFRCFCAEKRGTLKHS